MNRQVPDGGVQALKRRALEAIDARAERIVAIGEHIVRHPETGFREHETARFVASEMERIGLEPRTGLALTGVKAVHRAAPGSGPSLAILGELDALRVPDHPFAHPETGAAHACGHNAQIAGMLGAAMALVETGIGGQMGGNLVFMAVPAEEMIEVEYRLALREAGAIEFLTGKGELIRLGHFDDVDLALMCHTKSDDRASHLARSSNGALIKNIRFLGRAAHAGAAPQKGVNALNAANLAMTAIALLRETFHDSDTIRIHPIITRGGDAVSVVPAEVTLETFVRGRTLEGIVDANEKVDRALRGAALAIGTELEIETTAGYLPQRNDMTMGALWGANVEALYGPGQFMEEEHRTGSTDMGDLGHIMPVIHPYIRGASGTGHGSDYLIADGNDAYVGMARLLALTAIDLLADRARNARAVLESHRPHFGRHEYLEFCRGLNRRAAWDGAGRERGAGGGG